MLFRFFFSFQFCFKALKKPSRRLAWKLCRVEIDKKKIFLIIIFLLKNKKNFFRGFYEYNNRNISDYFFVNKINIKKN